MATTPDQDWYSIEAASELAGVSSHALQVWERLYGFPILSRSPAGELGYPKNLIKVIRHLAEQGRSGESIGVMIDAYREGRLKSTEGDITSAPPNLQSPPE